jgi:hypothetical protein
VPSFSERPGLCLHALPICLSYRCQHTRARVFCLQCHVTPQPLISSSASRLRCRVSSPPQLTFATRCVATSRCIVTPAAHCQCLSTPQKALCQGLEKKKRRVHSQRTVPHRTSPSDAETTALKGSWPKKPGLLQLSSLGQTVLGTRASNTGWTDLLVT